MTPAPSTIELITQILEKFGYGVLFLLLWIGTVGLLIKKLIDSGKERAKETARVTQALSDTSESNKTIAKKIGELSTEMSTHNQREHELVMVLMARGDRK